MKKTDIFKLTEDEFYDLYLPVCRPLDDVGENQKEDIRREFNKLSDSISKTLALLWTIDEDFSVPHDWNPCRSLSIAIYTSHIHSLSFINTVIDIIDQYPDWSLHIACECDELGEGQLFIHKGAIYSDVSADLDYTVFE